MRRLLVVAALAALTWARPETYKESEDFQYSRSSSDEGTKSGFYGAQRGNVGGNYERAHNMDSLAQHQMSSAVRQVDGELGDATKSRTGSAYTAANSRGIYGSGQYDLRNLKGRNFAESSDNSHSSLSSAYNSQLAASHSSGWNSESQQQSSRYQGSSHSNEYQARDQLGHTLTMGELQATDGNRRHDYTGQTGYYTQSGYHSGSSYDQANANYQSGALSGQQSGTRYIVAPVRVIVRPGSTIAVPIAAHTYDKSQSAAFVDQNAINSEAEVLDNEQRQGTYNPQSKHYESSYSYRKEWERHHANPLSTQTHVPTLSPLPQNSELYDEGQVAQSSDSLQQSSDSYNSHAQSVSRQSLRSSDHNSRTQSSSIGEGSYNSGAHSGLTQFVPVASGDSAPKSYQSSYSYHKSWERQGDPYVIIPDTNGGNTQQESQRLIAGTKQGTSSSHRYGSSQYRQSHQHYSQSNAMDCDEEGHVRVARSYGTGYNQQAQEDFGQQTQQAWESSNNYGSQARPQKLQDFGQQTQNNWEDLSQQEQKVNEHLEDLGQQTQNKWDDLGQQSQHSWDNLGHMTQQSPQKLEDLGQQTQNNWDNLGQQTQDNWDKYSNYQQQNRPQKLEDLSQQSEDLSQQSEDLTQQSQSNWQDFSQQAQSNLGNFEQSRPQKLEDMGQQTQDQWQGLNQQTQGNFGNLEDFGQQTQSKWHELDSFNQHTQQTWDRLDNSDQQTQNTWKNIESLGQPQNQWAVYDKHHTYTANTMQQIQTQSQNTDQGRGVIRDEQDNSNKQSSSENNPLKNLWSKIHSLEEQMDTYLDKDSNETQDSYNTQQHSYHSELHSSYASNSYHQNNFETTNMYAAQKPSHVFNSTEFKNTTVKPNIEQSPVNKTLENSNIGRGDIGNEDDHIEVDTKENTERHLTQTKPEKTPKEIEALSLTRETYNNNYSTSTTDSPLSVLSLSQQKWLEEQKRYAASNVDKNQTLILTSNQKHEKNGLNIDKTEVSFKNETKSILENPLEIQELLESQNNNKQHMSQEFHENLNHTFDQQNVNEFGQQTQDMEQNLEQHFENFGSHQQDLQQNLEEFGQQTQNKWSDMSQQTQDTWNKFDNMEQQNYHQINLEDLGQTQSNSYGLHQLPQSNLGNPEQQYQNPKLEDFGQQSQNLGQFKDLDQMQKSNQQKTQEFGDLEQETQDLDKKNIEQQFESLGPLPDLNQKNIQEQQTQFLDDQNAGQQFEDLGQHTQNFNLHTQKEFEDFGQQTQNLDQQTLSQFDFKTFNQDVSRDNGMEARELIPPAINEFQQQGIVEPTIHAINHQDSAQSSKINDLHNNPDVEIIQPVVVTTTEKPGFWKSVGNKFTSAKDSVASWFRRS